MTDNGHKEPDTVQVTIPIDLRFPMSMFLPSGALEHRIHRSKFLQQIISVNTWSAIYDDFAERARQELMTRDPLTIRPPLEKLGAVLLDIGAIAKAAEPQEEEEVTPGAV